VIPGKKHGISHLEQITCSFLEGSQWGAGLNDSSHFGVIAAGFKKEL
jgi:hypothetical protein